MILVLSGGGQEAQEISPRLDAEQIPHICFFSTFADAGTYGKGNALVGKLTPLGAEKILRQNKISGVVDVMADGYSEQSAVVMLACKACGVPYVKYLRPAIAVGDYDHVSVMGSYDAVADTINGQAENVLFYARPETVHAIASRIRDKKRLFTAIPRCILFDVELAMEFGIPLVNVMEVDGMDGETAVLHAMEKASAGMVVCDDSMECADKIAAAKQRKIPMILTHKTGIDYTQLALTGDETMDLVRAWLAKDKGQE
ncbi:MAG: precorrin-6A/cobalt-precorrin-6A reductase [Clostridia bacterium]|nr:precorrin-6A/cobalt-precorrin-6A reductase [Clostridia bacterium]